MILGVLALMLAGCVAAAVASSEGRSAAGPGARGRTARAAAVHDAARLLSRLVLPPGADTSAREPAHDGGVLANPGSRPATPNLIDRRGFWTVPGQPQIALGFIEAHRPAGSKLVETGSGGGGGKPTSWLAAFSWPPVAGVLGTRWLVVEVVGLPGGATGLRADAQVVWVSSRPASEQIPRGARVLDVSVARPGAKPLLSITVTSRGKVRAVVAMVDELPMVQPGAISCPAELTGVPVVTFTFRARRGGSALARASELADVTQPATACDAMTFTIRGHAEPSLLAGRAFLRSAQAVLGVTLARRS